jgi:hypothetical protein
LYILTSDLFVNWVIVLFSHFVKAAAIILAAALKNGKCQELSVSNFRIYILTY